MKPKYFFILTILLISIIFAIGCTPHQQANLAFDGTYLWVGEFKFSERLLRFSVQ